LSYFYNQISDTEWREAELLKDVLSTRDDESEIMFTGGSGLELSHLNCLISQADGRPPCMNGDIANQWEWSNYDHSRNQNPLTDYDKTLHN